MGHRLCGRTRTLTQMGGRSIVARLVQTEPFDEDKCIPGRGVPSSILADIDHRSSAFFVLPSTSSVLPPSVSWRFRTRNARPSDAILEFPTHGIRFAHCSTRNTSSSPPVSNLRHRARCYGNQVDASLLEQWACERGGRAERGSGKDDCSGLLA